MSVKTYYVWKRNDGYVSASCYMPSNYVTGGIAKGPNPLAYSTDREGAGIAVTFEQLLVTTDWNEAYALIAKHRQGAA